MQQLTDEFIHFQINQMTREEMATYVYNSMRKEIICQKSHLPLEESLKREIDDYDAHIKNEQIKANLTPEQLQELKDLYVDRLVDNMSVKDLVAYVTDDMTDYVNKLSPVEFFEEGYNYWEDHFDEIVEEVKGGQFENDLH